MDNKAYFTKAIKCPVCRKQFDNVVIKSSGTKLIKRDEDFCTYYEPINRVFYDVIICAECGYCAMVDRFEKISDMEIELVKENIEKRWTKRNFDLERTIDSALQIYKLALINLQAIKAKKSEFAKVCIRIAWLYRFLEDEKEKTFLKYALDSYLETYENEKLPIDKLDELTCMYMIGELYRRLDNKQEASKWFYNVISFKQQTGDNSNKSIINMAREQLQTIRGK